MKIGEAFPTPHASTPAFAVRSACEEDFRRYYIRGDVFVTLRDGKTGEVQEERAFLTPNLGADHG